MMKKHLHYLLLLLLALPAGSEAVRASDLAVGAKGQSIRLLTGSYGELFVSGAQAPSNASVLALELTDGETVWRELVPDTGDLQAERSPRLYHDPAYDATYVLWSSRHNIHPYLRLASLTESGWNDVLDITGSVFAEKYDPQLSVHHDTWTNAAGVRIDRTVLFIVWWEQAGATVYKRMTALVLENGALAGTTGILTLGDLVPRGQGQPYNSSLASTIRLIPSDSGLVLGFVSQGGKLEVLAADLLPVALSQLASRVEEAIRSHQGGPLEQTVIDAIASSGVEFHPATLQAMAEEVLALIETAPDGHWLGSELSELANKAMAHIVEIGARFKAGGLRGNDLSMISVRSEDPTATTADHHLAVSHVGSLQIPEGLSVAGNATLFVSKRAAALVAWDEESAVAYREATSDGGWSEINHLRLDAFVDRDTAYRILEERTLER